MTAPGSGDGNSSVTSVFGRTGAVAAHAGDYNASQITGLANVVTSGNYNNLTDKTAIPSIASNTALPKGDGAGNAAAATAGTDYMSPSTPVHASQLPPPGVSTLRGVQSKDCTGNGHPEKINLDGSVTCSPNTGSGLGAKVATTTLILKGDSAGNAVAAAPGIDYMTPSPPVAASQLPFCMPTAGQGFFVPLAPTRSAALSYALNIDQSGSMVFDQMLIPCPMAFSKALFNVTTASGTSCTGGTCGFVVAIWSGDGNTLIAKTAPVVSDGSPDLNATGGKSASFPSVVSLQPGAYWLSAYSDSSALRITGLGYVGTLLNADGVTRVGSAQNATSGDGAAIAMPASVPALTPQGNSGYSIWPVLIFAR